MHFSENQGSELDEEYDEDDSGDFHSDDYEFSQDPCRTSFDGDSTPERSSYIGAFGRNISSGRKPIVGDEVFNQTIIIHRS